MDIDMEDDGSLNSRESAFGSSFESEPESLTEHIEVGSFVPRECFRTVDVKRLGVQNAHERVSIDFLSFEAYLLHSMDRMGLV